MKGPEHEPGHSKAANRPPRVPNLRIHLPAQDLGTELKLCDGRGCRHPRPREEPPWVRGTRPESCALSSRQGAGPRKYLYSPALPSCTSQQPKWNPLRPMLCALPGPAFHRLPYANLRRGGDPVSLQGS